MNEERIATWVSKRKQVVIPQPYRHHWNYKENG